MDAKDSQAAQGSGPWCRVTLEAKLAFRLSRAVPATSHLQCRYDGLHITRPGITPQQPARCRVQVQLSGRSPGLFLPLIALLCCSPARCTLPTFISLSITTRVTDKHSVEPVKIASGELRGGDWQPGRWPPGRPYCPVTEATSPVHRFHPPAARLHPTRKNPSGKRPLRVK